MDFDLKVKLWDAINAYVETCGGKPEKYKSNIKRQNAVVEIEKLINKIEHKVILCPGCEGRGFEIVYDSCWVDPSEEFKKVTCKLCSGEGKFKIED